MPIFKGDVMKRNSNAGKYKCSSCGNYHYQWWMISHKQKVSQKIGCASYMIYNISENSYQINCSYGSGYDGLRFKIMNNSLLLNKHKSALSRLIKQVQLKKEPIICDKCLQRFIKKKQIIDLDSL